MTIDREFIASLPDDPSEAFIKFESKARREMNVAERSDDWSAEIDYVSSLHMFARLYGLRDLAARASMNFAASDDKNAELESIFNFVALERKRIEFEAGVTLRIAKRSNSLTSEEKQQIHDYVREIRSIVTEATIPDAKRESIFAALGRLEFEIDANRTPMDVIADNAMRLADVAAYVGEKAAPMRGLFDRILRLLDRGRQSALPAPSEDARLQLPAPEENV